MSPSAVMNEKTSQFELGPCFSVQVCPPSWRFCATVLPMPPMLQGDNKYLMPRRRGKDVPAAVRQPYHARGGVYKVSVRCKVSVRLFKRRRGLHLIGRRRRRLGTELRNACPDIIAKTKGLRDLPDDLKRIYSRNICSEVSRGRLVVPLPSCGCRHNVLQLDTQSIHFRVWRWEEERSSSPAYP